MLGGKSVHKHVKTKSILLNPFLTAIAACQNSSYKNWQKFNNASAMLMIAKKKDTSFILLHTPEKELELTKRGIKNIWQIITNLARIKPCSLNNMVSWISANTSEDATHESNFTDLLKKRNRVSSKQKLSFLKEKVYVTGHKVYIPQRSTSFKTFSCIFLLKLYNFPKVLQFQDTKWFR